MERFLVDKFGLKNWHKLRLTPYHNAYFLEKNGIFEPNFFSQKRRLKALE